MWPPKCHDHGITGIGNINADIMIIGIAPGANEMSVGEPFIGQSGHLLNTVLKAVGIDRDDLYLTNICCWRPPDDKPTPEDIAECMPRLREEIETVRPRLIIPLGALPAEVMTGSNPHARGKNGKFSISKVRGQPLFYEEVLGTSVSCRIMPTWHPAAFLRESGQNIIVDICRDFQKIMPSPKGVDLLSWDQHHGSWDWALFESPEDLASLEDFLDADWPVAIDIETGNPENVDEMTMDVFKERLICFSIAQSNPFLGRTLSFVFTPPTFNAFVDWFNQYGSRFRWLTHYGFFDKQGLRKLLGINLEISEDTLAAGYALDERQGVHSLKSSAREYVGADFWEAPVHAAIDEWRRKAKLLALQIGAPGERGPWTDEVMCDPDVDLRKEKGRLISDALGWSMECHNSRRTMDDDFLDWYNGRLEEIKTIGWDVVPTNIMYPYNAEDSARTAQLLNVYTDMMKDDGVYELYTDLMIPDMNVNADIAYHGMHVNQEALDDLVLKWGPRWQELQKELVDEATERGFAQPVYDKKTGEIIGTEPLNLASPRQKAKFIYDTLAIEPPVSKHGMTKTGQQSTNIKLLERVKDQDEWLQKYIAFTHLDHSMGSYILPMPGFLRDDGRIHAQWKPHAARTGRDSFASPPLHQIPKYVEEDVEFLRFIGGTGHELRELFDTGDDDYVFVEADFNRGEFYCGAYLTGDDKLLEICRSQDMHRATAADILFHIPWDEVTDKQRRDAKYVNFGMFFGIQAEALAKDQLHCPVWEAEAMIRAWWNGFSVAKRWVQERRLEAMQTGEIITPGTGRKRRFRLILGDASFHELNQAVNAPIQGLLGDYQKAARIDLARELQQYRSHVVVTCHDMIGAEIHKSFFGPAVRMWKEVMEAPRFGFPGIPIEMKAGPDWGHTKVIQDDDPNGGGIRLSGLTGKIKVS